MRIDFESLPDSARIWTFGVQRALTQAEQDDLLAAVDGFLDDWIAHGTPLQGARDWRHGRLLLVGVDEDAAPPSGCSIDALVHSLKAMESTLGTRIVDNSRVWYMEGGDVAWIDERNLAVGLGYRTNAEGIRQLRALLGSGVDRVVPVPLPHWRGPDDVFHLMSMFSPVDRDLAVVYSPLLPVPFRQLLLKKGYELVEVPHEEFESMGCNVLAAGPRRCVAVDGNPVTRRRLEAAGAEVHTYRGREISTKGGGGPTCLTRPLVRSE